MLRQLGVCALPATLTGIGGSAFRHCPSLKTVDLEGTHVVVIPDHCFEGCGSLACIIVPASLEVIGDYVCAGCGVLSAADASHTALRIVGKFFNAGRKPEPLKVVLPPSFQPEGCARHMD